MANPVLSDKGFERGRDESEPGWAAPDTVMATHGCAAGRGARRDGR